MQKTICDLCKREISEFGESEMRIFKIKEYRWFYGSWNRIDAHQSCVRKLFYAAKSKTQAVPVGGSSMQDE